MKSIKKTAQDAGFWYLLVAIFGSFYTIFIESKLIVSGDATATITNILSSEGLFRFCILSNIITTICFLMLASALYKLFMPVDENLVRVMVLFIIASVPMASLQSLKFAPILISSKASYLAAFEPAQLNALAMIFLDLQKLALSITYVFYGLWMLPLGMLVFKSGPDFLSKGLGTLLVIGCFGYVSKFIEILFVLNTEVATSNWMNFTILIEILFILWLFIRGPRQKKPAPIIMG